MPAHDTHKHILPCQQAYGQATASLDRALSEANARSSMPCIVCSSMRASSRYARAAERLRIRRGRVQSNLRSASGSTQRQAVVSRVSVSGRGRQGNEAHLHTKNVDASLLPPSSRVLSSALGHPDQKRCILDRTRTTPGQGQHKHEECMRELTGKRLPRMCCGLRQTHNARQACLTWSELRGRPSAAPTATTHRSQRGTIWL